MFQPHSNPTCPRCGMPTMVQTENGHLVEFCVKCHNTTPVPVQGSVKHDQRERLESVLKRSAF